jgi:diguanylate cyclase (GGDEF)-like protein/PAS domain S-box-containing protein
MRSEQFNLSNATRSDARYSRIPFLVRKIEAALGADYVCIEEFANANSGVKTLAILVDGTLGSDAMVGLHDAACQVMPDRDTWIVEHLSQGFPYDHRLTGFGAECLICCKLIDANDVPIGRIVTISRRAVENTSAAEATMQLASAGVVAEMERLRLADSFNALQTDLLATRSVIPDLLIEAGLDGRIHYFQSGSLGLLSASSEFLSPQKLSDLLPANACAVCLNGLLQVSQTGPLSGWQLQASINGATIWFEIAITPKVNLNGDGLRFFVLCRNISAQKNAEEALRVSEARYRRGQEIGRVGNWELNLETNFFWGSDEAKRIYGFQENHDCFSLDEVEKCIPERDRVNQALNDLIQDGKEHILEHEIRPRNGANPRIVRSIAEVQRDASGRPLVVVGVIQDITAQKLLQNQTQLVVTVFQKTREGIVITDAAGFVVEVNTTFTLLTGYRREDVVGRAPHLHRLGRRSRPEYRTVLSALKDHGHWYGELTDSRKDGQPYIQMLSVSAVFDSEGQVQNYVALFTDVTPAKEQQRQLEHAAHYDSLTGLPNRVLLAENIQLAISHSQQHQQFFAVFYLDIDDFKSVNDLHGAGVGDDLLIAVARCIKALLRQGDTLARIGGDEFVVLLTDLNGREDYERVLRDLLRTADNPLVVRQHVFYVSFSIGVTLSSDDGSDADVLLRHADQALYIAKQAGKNRFHLFDVAQDAAGKSKRDALEQIRRGIDRGEFVLYYQPKVNMRTGAVIGVEALIRWQHPENGLMQPAEFLPIIEDHAMSVDIGEWVINAALTQIAHWRSVGLEIAVSVNVGARQLQQADFATRLSRLLAAHADVPPSFLELEILETSALSDIAQVTQTMVACQAFGMHFAIDDFGTGYSSLAYLKRLPAEVLKIDQSFIRDMVDDPNSLAIVQGIIGLAHNFRRIIIAEGVETLAHGDLLLTLGCELAQGYGIARPMAAATVPDWVAGWHQRAIQS